MKKITQKGNVRVNVVQILAMLIIYILNCCTSEFFKVAGFTIVLLLGSYLCWLYFASKLDRTLIYNIYYISWPLIICMILLLIFSITGLNSKHISLSFENIIYFIIFISLFLYFGKNWDDKRNKTIVVFWIVDTVVACIYSIYRLRLQPTLARDLSTGMGEIQNARGVIAFGVVYGMVLFIPILMWLVFSANEQKKLRKRSRLIWAAVLTIMLYAIILAQFTIAIFLALLGIVLWWSYTFIRKKKSLHRIIYIVIILIFLIGIFLSLEQIFLSILEWNILPFEVVKRIKELIEFFHIGRLSEGSDALLRYSLYEESFGAIFDNYLLGYCLLGRGVVGGHSEILDMIANYGISYFVLFMTSVLRIVKKISNSMFNETRGIFLISTILLLLQSIINTSFMSSIMGIYIVIIPFALRYYQTRLQ